MYKLFAYTAILLASLATSVEAATVHSVRKGETLTEIAQAYKVTVQAIKDANKLSNANTLSVGQKLNIPAPAPQFTEYKIRNGDNLSDIAKEHGVTLRSITALNAIGNANRIRVGQVIKIPLPSDGAAPAAAAPTTYLEYKVRSGDSLSDIAKKYGVTVSTLTSLNSIRRANSIKIGQVIRIPVAPGTVPLPTGPRLANSDQSTLDRIRTKSSQWKHIVIHHSATRVGSAKGMDNYHRNERRMENGLAYHFVIGNGRGMKDGELYIGDRWKKQLQGGHVSSYALNQISIGICLVGDFSKTRPTTKQMETLEALVEYLMDKTHVPVSRVTTHTLIHPKHTQCPGKYFPTESFKAKLD
ncbi:LysM peptidoglycan-binding domain-containing protein [Pelagicoccus sp. SDUM812005]|uniref:LysM peptidoglycan-binding domain-containing protein n=1 Tax=Pelagicoccus sp. SDUM812005 TaxID=3041257 RepID=UPI0028102CB5|nr:LysM peptidoglycan-binding domain-containing protein [Pelagicoccus sp. SDUM812005]MDQ8180980.1 LysM peptidoglycan-binding domain-containing protein [Pelagicoccus sp. SDUM812005]